MILPRRYSAPRLLRRLLPRHPELARPCHWHDLLTIAGREGIRVRVVPFPAPIRGQILRFSGTVVIQIANRLRVRERTVVGFHELTHFWMDPSTELAFRGDQSVEDDLEEFCNIFAWYVTTPQRPQPRRPRRRG